MKDYKETLRRAARTFLQAAVAYIAVNAGAIAFGDDIEILKRAIIGLLLSAGAAGIAAIMNLPAGQRPEEDEEVLDNG